MNAPSIPTRRRVFPSLFAKEAREALPVLAAICVLVPLLAFLLRDRYLCHEICIGLALIVAIFGVGTDMIAGERRRRSLALLQRLPCGPLPILLAKVSVLVIITALGAGIAFAACAGSVDDPYAGIANRGAKMLRAVDWILLCILGNASWLLWASSCWRRASAVLLATGMATLGVGALVLLTSARTPSVDATPWLTTLAVAGLLSAVVAAIRSLRFEVVALHNARIGLAALFVIPLLAASTSEYRA